MRQGLLPVPALGEWRHGNTQAKGVWRFYSETPGHRLLVVALVRGTDMCGAWALQSALEAQLRPRSGTLTLAFCNLEAFDRFDPRAPHACAHVDEDLDELWTADRPMRHRRAGESRRAGELAPFVEEADWLLARHSLPHAGRGPALLPGLCRRNISLAFELGARHPDRGRRPP
jgi:hypothetical protein